MTQATLPNPQFPSRCSVSRHHGKPDSRWHMRDLAGVSIIAALDLWAVLAQAHAEGFEQAMINDDGSLYLLTIEAVD